jgi:hypothetical protein
LQREYPQALPRQRNETIEAFSRKPSDPPHPPA